MPTCCSCAYQRDGDASDLAKLRGVFSDQIAQLNALAAQAPPTAQPGFSSAAALLADLDQQARVLCGNCGPDAGVSGFVDLSSAPTIGSLWTQPASAAAADALRNQTKQLANKAGEIAKHTPQPPVATPQTNGSTTRSGSSGGVTAPDLSAQKDQLKGSVTGVTNGVTGLLDQVGSSTGLTPLTDAVNDTLDTLTTILLGP